MSSFAYFDSKFKVLHMCPHTTSVLYVSSYYYISSSSIDAGRGGDVGGGRGGLVGEAACVELGANS